MPLPVIDVGSNLEGNLERWSRALKGGGDKLAVFEIIYSGKRRRWTAKEITDQLGGEITQKRVTEVGKKLVGDSLVNQVTGVFPVVYEKRSDVHHYKAKILAGARGKVRVSGKANTVSNKRASRRKGSGEMSEAEAAQGKRVVEKIISDLCAESGVILTKPVSWHYDFDRMSYWFTFEIDGQEKNWQLSQEKITDSVNDRTVRTEIEKGLRMYVIPSPKTGPAIPPKRDIPAPPSPNPSFDVFLCHASEDKAFVDALADAIKDAGISVWYDKDLISWGDDLRHSIDRGLINSKYGIVVFSKAFLKKKRWTEHELNGLFAKERDGRKVILPIWHDITQQNLEAYSLSFVDRIALRSDRHPVSEIVRELKALL